jgi:shikimate kinase
MKNKVILVGYMAAGKTTIAEKLSKKIDLEFIDLDKFIENREGSTIDELFKDRGEVYFRKQEHLYFKRLVENKKSYIISTGGGTPCYSDNHLLLQHDNVISFYLKASIETLVQRLNTSKIKRPILENFSGDELSNFIGNHLFERSFFYLKAKHIIDVNDKSTDQIVDEILSKLNQ